jgi:cytoskeletal protein CcmA (bactofilin family)
MEVFMLTFIMLVSPLIGQAAGQEKVSEEQNEVTSLPAGAVVNKDYFAYGERIEISGTVNGDVYVAGGQVLIDGKINGDLLAAGGMISVSGAVSQDARIAGGKVTVNGDIGRNLTVAGGNVELTHSAKVRGGLVLAGGAVGLAAPVGKDAKIAAGNVTVSGAVNGNLHAAAGELRLTSNAEVSGNLTYWSGKPASIDPGAKVGKDVTRKTVPEFPSPNAGKLLGVLAGFLLFVKLVSFVSTLILGLLWIYLFPRYMQSAVSTLRKKPWASLGIGFAVFVITPVTAGLLAVTLVGIPLALIVTAVYFIAIYLVRVLAILWVGSGLFKWMGRPIHEAWALTIGLVIYSVLTLIPFIGGLVTMLVVLLGLGAALLGLREDYRAVIQKKEVQNAIQA